MKTEILNNASAWILAICMACVFAGCGHTEDPAQVESEFAQLVDSVEISQSWINKVYRYADNGRLAYINDIERLKKCARVLTSMKEACERAKTARPTTAEERKIMAGYRSLNVKKIDAVLDALKERYCQICDTLKTWSANGRKLFCGVIQANIEREAVGLGSLWPKTAKTASSDKEDISGMVFKNATAYFNTLFDMANKSKGDWEPYVSGLEPDCAFCEGKSMWNVAAGVTDEMEDIVPVFISANFDCRNLPKKSYDGKRDADKLIPIGTCPVLGNSGIVVIYKGGATTYFTADKVTLGNIFKKQAVWEMPEYYLAP